MFRSTAQLSASIIRASIEGAAGFTSHAVPEINRVFASAILWQNTTSNWGEAL
jgi:hypothetical protein